jgi:hypothetical protein
LGGEELILQLIWCSSILSNNAMLCHVTFVITSRPGANVIKLFTVVIYHHSMVILSFCVLKLHSPGNYRGMAVNYQGILTLEKVG